MLSIVAIAVRSFQFLFAVIVLGLATALAKQQVFGAVPATTGYSSFAGGFGVLVAILGFASLWIQAIPSLVVLAFDGLLAVLFLCGGIAWAVGLKGINCGNKSDGTNVQNAYSNGLLNEGCTSNTNGQWCGVDQDTNFDSSKTLEHLMGNCTKAMTTEIFSFLAFLFLAILLGLGYVIMRKGGVSRGKSNFVSA